MERPPPQPPNVRRGKVFAGSVEVLDWSETGLVIDMGGSKTDKSKRKDEVVAKEAPPPKDENAGKAEHKGTGAIRVGDKLVYLPDQHPYHHQQQQPADPRAARRKRRLPPGRALLPHDPTSCTEHQWEASARGGGAYGDAVARDWGDHLQAATMRGGGGAAAAGGGAGQQHTRPESTFSVLSYQVLSQERASEMSVVKSSLLRAGPRRVKLLKEIVSYDADVICLQDVDNYVEFWQPNLTLSGYDSVFVRKTNKQRPRSPLAEGVLVAWHRDQFNLVRSKPVELNDLYEEVKSRDPALAMECVSDDVAVMCHLMPWQDGWHPSPLCVVSAMLKEGQDEVGSKTGTGQQGGKMEKARAEQAKYLTTTIERFNADLAAPVILCGGFETTPMSTTYDILAAGCLPLDPGPPKRPKFPPIPKVDSSTSVRLKWKPPVLDLEALDPPIEGYLLAWRPGGHRNLGFKEQVYVLEAEAIVYDIVVEEGKGARTVRSEYLQFSVMGLSSSTPYEFRFAAVNELGAGPWSDPSAAVQCPQIGDNVAPFQALLTLDQWLLRTAQGKISLQALLIAAKKAKLVDSNYVSRIRADIRDGKQAEFYYVQEVLRLLRDAKHVSNAETRKLIQSFGKPPPYADLELAALEGEHRLRHKFASATNLTPRFSDSGLPASSVAPVRKQDRPFHPSSTASGAGDGADTSFHATTRDQLHNGLASSRSGKRVSKSSSRNGGDGGGGGGGFEMNYFDNDEVFGDDDLLLNGGDDNDDGDDDDVDDGDAGDGDDDAKSHTSCTPSMNNHGNSGRVTAQQYGDFSSRRPLTELERVEEEMRSDQRRALGDLGHGGGDDGGGRGNEAVGTAVRAGTAGGAGTGTGGGAGGGGGGTSGRGLGCGFSSSAHPIPPTITGLADSRQQHRLVLKSAYSSYSWDGEPPLTCVEQNFVGTLDYVMYSSEKLVPATVLSLPELDELINDDPSALEMAADDSLGSDPPNGWNADFEKSKSSSNPLSYSGSWAGAIKENEHRTHHFLPNEEYGATHLALLVEFRFLTQGIETDITEAVETGIESMSISDYQLAARTQEDEEDEEEEEEGRGHVEGQEEI